MIDAEKVKIKPDNEESDYSLWRIRIRAAISAKEQSSSLKTEPSSARNWNASQEFNRPTQSRSGDEASTTSTDKYQQASNIFISALVDHALSVVRGVIDSP